MQMSILTHNLKSQHPLFYSSLAPMAYLCLLFCSYFSFHYMFLEDKEGTYTPLESSPTPLNIMLYVVDLKSVL